MKTFPLIVKYPVCCSGVYNLRLPQVTRLPGEPCNDNQRIVMTGEFNKDLANLMLKWGFDARKSNLWFMLVKSMGQQSLKVLSDEALTMAGALENGDAVMAAAGISIITTLMAVIKTLPDQESRLLLDHLTSSTDEVVTFLVKREVANG